MSASVATSWALIMTRDGDAKRLRIGFDGEPENCDIISSYRPLSAFSKHNTGARRVRSGLSGRVFRLRHHTVKSDAIDPSEIWTARSLRSAWYRPFKPHVLAAKVGKRSRSVIRVRRMQLLGC
jgi:hypothetical protein